MVIQHLFLLHHHHSILLSHTAITNTVYIFSILNFLCLRISKRQVTHKIHKTKNKIKLEYRKYVFTSFGSKTRVTYEYFYLYLFYFIFFFFFAYMRCEWYSIINFQFYFHHQTSQYWIIIRECDETLDLK